LLNRCSSTGICAIACSIRSHLSRAARVIAAFVFIATATEHPNAAFVSSPTL